MQSLEPKERSALWASVRTKCGHCGKFKKIKKDENGNMPPLFYCNKKCAKLAFKEKNKKKVDAMFSKSTQKREFEQRQSDLSVERFNATVIVGDIPKY